VPLSDAAAFAESVAGVLERHGTEAATWAPGEPPRPPSPKLATALEELGWDTLAHDQALVSCAGLAGVELGRRLAALRHVDRLLDGGPLAGELVRSLGEERVAVVGERRVFVHHSQPVASADGLDVHRTLQLGEPIGTVAPSAVTVWRAALVGYLAGLGLGALDLTVGYVKQRRAFGTTLATLAAVQQLLADAATAVDGVLLLAGEAPGADALAYAGPAVTDACGACQQVTGAIGFTLEYPLHRYTQRARALASWNDALLA
jgi:acyl-CoA dehydrogenase-like protein